MTPSPLVEKMNTLVLIGLTRPTLVRPAVFLVQHPFCVRHNLIYAVPILLCPLPEISGSTIGTTLKLSTIIVQHILYRFLQKITVLHNLLMTSSISVTSLSTKNEIWLKLFFYRNYSCRFETWYDKTMLYNLITIIDKHIFFVFMPKNALLYT